MHFDLTPEQRQIRERASGAAATLATRARDFEREELIPPSVFADLGRRGLMSVAVSRELGGSQAGTLAYSLAMTEVATGCAATAVTMAVTNMVGEVLERFGSAAQRSTWCPRLAAGELGAFALSEVGAGSDPGAMRTRARLEGEEWVIDGDKQWISHGDQASVVVIWARTEETPGARGLSAFVVPTRTASGELVPGFRVEKHEDKLGLRASHTAALVFEGLRVPKDALLAERGAGFRIAMVALDGGRIGVASQALGIAKGALRHLEREYCAGRVPQVLLFRVADMHTRLDAAELMIWRAAMLKERSDAYSLEASMAKAFATEAAWFVCQEAAEVAAELRAEEAIREDGVLARALRDVRVTMIYEGTSEVQRVVIGRALTR